MIARTTISNVVAAPNPTTGAPVTLTATASVVPARVTQAEWFVGADPGEGNGTPMTVTGTGPWNLAGTVDVSTWANGSYTLSVRALNAGGWSVPGTTTLVVNKPLPTALYFSTAGNTNPPGVGGGADDADIYARTTAFSRQFDATANGLPGGANVDGYERVDATHFYLSFSNTTTTVPGIGTVQDEDVVYYNAGTWSLYFDGSTHGLGTSGNQDLDEIAIVGTTLYFSTAGDGTVPGVATPDDADIYSWNGTSFARVWDATAAGLATGANVDGLQVIDATHFYLSFSSTTTAVPVLGNVQDEDVVYFNAGTWSVYFDGTPLGLTSGDEDLDAIAFGDVPPPPALTFSTAGNTNPPGLGGTADDADVYGWLTAFSRQFDATANGLSNGANVDGYERVDATHFYLSFSTLDRRAGHRHGSGRGRRLLQRRYVVAVLRRQHARP